MRIKSKIYGYDPNPPFHNWVCLHDVSIYMTADDWGEEITRLMTEFPDFGFWGTDAETGDEVYCYTTTVDGDYREVWYYVPHDDEEGIVHGLL